MITLMPAPEERRPPNRVEEERAGRPGLDRGERARLAHLPTGVRSEVMTFVVQAIAVVAHEARTGNRLTHAVIRQTRELAL